MICQNCAKEVPDNAHVCPYCKLRPSPFRGWGVLFLVVGGLVILFAISGIALGLIR